MQLIKDTTFVALDLETTGLTPMIDRIVEIGAVKFKDGQEIDIFHKLIDPEMQICPDAFAINGITEEMLKGKPIIDNVLPEFIEFIGNDVPIAHNATFDAVFLSYDIRRLGLNVPDIPIIDTCSLPRFYFPSLNSYSLANLSTDLNIKSEGLHRALADAKLCMEVFLKCIDETGCANNLTLDQIMNLDTSMLSLNTGGLLLEKPFSPLKNALKLRKKIKIVYEDRNGLVSVRKITPLAISLFRSTVMVEAFCHMSQDERKFRLDRIVEIR
ncbi:MAG: exonuclease domain-containing protein [Spirochaetota bacterium]|nr:exonuclease domain-containing protein [Spirochaetota bacterium]